MLEIVEKTLWLITSLILILSGIYFSIKLRFPQVNIKRMYKSIKTSSLSTLNLTLGAKIGVGSLAGVALAIYIGGIGSIFWMWISVLLCTSNTYVECFLSVINRKKDKIGLYYGGPSTYIKNNNLSKLYSTLVILAYTCGFLTIQINTITKVLTNTFNTQPLMIGITIAVIICPIIFGGIKKISKVCNVIVPLMTSIYIMVVSIILLSNLSTSLLIIKNIIVDALHPKSLIGFFTTFVIGIERGIFSNESGIGTSAMSAATTTLDKKNECYLQIIGVYITTLFICTLTSLFIILSDYNKLNITDINGIEITKYAFYYHLGNFGTIILTITIILFALSTVITGYYYGEANYKMLTNRSTIILKIVTLLLIVLGSLLSSTLLWYFVDILVSLMAIINIYALLSQRNNVKK